jgi:hypothetical protein
MLSYGQRQLIPGQAKIQANGAHLGSPGGQNQGTGLQGQLGTDIVRKKPRQGHKYKRLSRPKVGLKNKNKNKQETHH